MEGGWSAAGILCKGAREREKEREIERKRIK